MNQALYVDCTKYSTLDTCTLYLQQNMVMSWLSPHHPHLQGHDVNGIDILLWALWTLWSPYERVKDQFEGRVQTSRTFIWWKSPTLCAYASDIGFGIPTIKVCNHVVNRLSVLACYDTNIIGILLRSYSSMYHMYRISLQEWYCKELEMMSGHGKSTSPYG